MKLFVLTHLIEDKKNGNYCAEPQVFLVKEMGTNQMKRELALYYQNGITDEVKTYGDSMAEVATLDGKHKDTFYLNEVHV